MRFVAWFGIGLSALSARAAPVCPPDALHQILQITRSDRPLTRPENFPRGEHYAVVATRRDLLSGGEIHTVRERTGRPQESSFEGGLLPRGFDHSPSYLKRAGFRALPDHQAEIPDVHALNGRAERLAAHADRRAPIVRFVETDPRQANDILFAEHWVKGEVVVASDGEMNFHDRQQHAPGYFALTEATEPVVLRTRARLRALLEIRKRLRAEKDPRVQALAEQIENVIKGEGERIDSASVNITDALGRVGANRRTAIEGAFLSLSGGPNARSVMNGLERELDRHGIRFTGAQKSSLGGLLRVLDQRLPAGELEKVITETMLLINDTRD